LKLLVSACLLGENCKYNGGNNRSEALLALLARYPVRLVPVCPEQLGGLSTPRVPAECREGRVVDRNGQDVTAAFDKGAALTVTRCLQAGCAAAVLKARSPSCGSGQVYDGSFSGVLVAGDGVTCARLKAAEISVFTETELDALEALLAAQSVPQDIQNAAVQDVVEK
jgi:uncharacterized protein YbbK (DUF523 family)